MGEGKEGEEKTMQAGKSEMPDDASQQKRRSRYGATMGAARKQARSSGWVASRQANLRPAFLMTVGPPAEAA